MGKKMGLLPDIDAVGGQELIVEHDEEVRGRRGGSGFRAGSRRVGCGCVLRV